MTDKEQVIIDGKGCKYKTWDAECSLTGDHYGDNMKPCKFIDEKSCHYKQLARKTQECEKLKAEEKYLKQCCEKAGEELAKHSFDYDGKEKNLVVQAMELNEKYEKLEKALEEIETELSIGFTTTAFYKILNIINNAKGEGK